MITKPILVVGGTGRVGRLIIQQLLADNIPTRAFVCNSTKAHELWTTTTTADIDQDETKQDTDNLEVMVGDITNHTPGKLKQ